MRVLVFGDSIAYGAWDSRGGWVDRLKAELHGQTVASGGNRKVRLLNLGIGGDTSTKILARLDSEVRARYSASWPLVFVFAFGTNDSREIDGAPETSVDTFKENVAAIIDAARAYTDKILFVGGSPLQHEALDFKGQLYKTAAIREYYQIQREIVTAQDIPFVEVDAAFESDRDKLFSYDGLHPNDAGHEIILKLVRPEVEKLIAR